MPVLNHGDGCLIGNEGDAVSVGMFHGDARITKGTCLSVAIVKKLALYLGEFLL